MADGLNTGKDSLDITELTSLNGDVSDEMINQLEHQLTDKINEDKTDDIAINENDDSTLFEEPTTENNEPKDKSPDSAQGNIEQNSNNSSAEENDADKNVNNTSAFEDKFAKKYKEKLKKRALGPASDNTPPPSYGGVAPAESEETQDDEQNSEKTDDSKDVEHTETKEAAVQEANENIADLSKGNITEKPLTNEQKKYAESLDYLDGNVKYSKYVIYIDPQNVDFMESLTVKERKNLINNILKEQNDITKTKLRFKVAENIIKQVIVSILTLAISIPLIYYAINFSLEATINNHRNAQTIWQTLYKENGKINRY